MSIRLTGRERVLVRAPSWLGDFVAAEPIVRALYESHARAGTEDRITIAAPERFFDLFRGRFERATRYPLRSAKSFRAHGQLPATEFAGAWRGNDVAILLNGSWKSAWTAWLARIPERGGFARGGRGCFLTHAWSPAREIGRVPVGLGRSGRFPRWLPRPFGAAAIELASSMGLEIRDRAPHLVVEPGSLTVVRERLTENGLAPETPFVLANAGARPDSAKAFPPDRFALVLDEIAHRTQLPIVIACAPGEEASARATHAACSVAPRSSSSGARVPVVLLVEPAVELLELCALSSIARLCVTPDNGARHIAQAFGTPTVVLCGPTDPRHTAEHGPRTRVVRITVPCGPCHREQCPLTGDAHHACMREIEIERIVDAAMELLHLVAPR